MNVRGVYAGSFDPITLGHLDIIERASKLFDHVIVGVGINLDKQSTFTADERIALVQPTVQHIRNVSVKSFDGLLVDFARTQKCQTIIRGLRAMMDFDYEFQMGLANKGLDPTIETIFLLTDQNHIFISSSLVKEIVMGGGDVSGFVPPHVKEFLIKKLHLTM